MSSNSFSDNGDEEEGSGVYRNKLKFQRPTTITRRRWVENLNLRKSGILIEIGEQFLLWMGCLETWHTHAEFLNRLLFMSELKMWEPMAELSVKRLKPNDFIYVSRRLCSCTKADQNGNLIMRYKLDVKELNYGRRIHNSNRTRSKAMAGLAQFLSDMPA